MFRLWGRDILDDQHNFQGSMQGAGSDGECYERPVLPGRIQRAARLFLHCLVGFTVASETGPVRPSDGRIAALPEAFGLPTLE